MVQVFDEYVLLPISNGEDISELCKFFESCPVKLFESIFANFLKDRQVDFEIVAQLLKNNRVGAYILTYYIVNYSQPFEKQDIVEMVKQLHSSLLQNMDDRELQCCNLYILNILVSDAVLPYVDFNLQMFVSTENIQHETEMQNKITSALIMQEL